MQTHVHKVKHLVVSTFEQGLKRWRGVGSLSPSRRACKVGFDTFEKMKCIFFYCTNGKFDEVIGVSLDANSSGVGHWLASGALLLSVTLLSEVSEHPMGSCWTRASHCLSIWWVVTSIGSRDRVLVLCSLDIGCVQCNTIEHIRHVPNGFSSLLSSVRC